MYRSVPSATLILKWNRFQQNEALQHYGNLEKTEACPVRLPFFIVTVKLPFGIGTGTSHMTGILEGLGRATLDISETPGRLLDRALKIAGRSSTCILITPEGGEKDRDPEGYMEELKAGIEQIRIQSGHAGKKHLQRTGRQRMTRVISGSGRWRRH